MQLIRVPAKSSRAGDLTPPRAFHQVPPGVPVRASNVRSWPKRDVQRFGQRQAPSRDRATRDREPGTGLLGVLPGQFDASTRRAGGSAVLQLIAGNREGPFLGGAIPVGIGAGLDVESESLDRKSVV